MIDQNITPVSKTSKNGFKLATWNIRTSIGHAGRQLELLVADLETTKVSVCAIQETRRRNTDSITVGNYLFLFSAANSDGNYGVGFAIHKKFAGYVLNWHAIDERLCKLQIRLNNQEIILISALAPTNLSDLETKENFYSTLDSLCPAVRVPGFILGDFNADVESVPSTENQILFNSLCNCNKLRVANRIFRHRKRRRTTFQQLSNKKWVTIDLVLVNKAALRLTRDCKNIMRNKMISDHRPVEVKLQWTQFNLTLQQRNKMFRRSQRNLVKKSFFTWCPRLNVKPFSDPMLQERYQAKLAAELRPNDEFENSSRIIYNVAKEFSDKKYPPKDWYTDFEPILQPFIKAKAIAYDLYQQCPTLQHHKKYKEARLAANNAVQAARNAWLQQVAGKLEENAQNNSIREVFQAIPQLCRSGYRKNVVLRSIADFGMTNEKCAEMFQHHFNKVLNCPPPDAKPVNARSLFPLATVDEVKKLASTPDIKEVAASLKALKCNKAVGPDGLPGELWRYGGDHTLNVIFNEILKVWNSEVVSSLWTQSDIIPLFKKGNRMDPVNYRPISLLNTSGAVLTHLVNKRLQNFLQCRLSESQHGFRRNRSTIDLIYSLRQLQEHSIEWNKPLFALFIDFTKAFDSLDRNDLFRILSEIGVPSKLVNIIKALHSSTISSVRLGSSHSSCFATNTGVRQGCKLAPLLFALHLDVVMKSLRQKVMPEWLRGVDINDWSQSKAKLVDKECLLELLFADDTTIIASSIDTLQQSLIAIDEIGRSTGLRINLAKTVVMSLNPKMPLNISLTLGDTTVTRVAEFKFLGSIISSDGVLDNEIKERIKCAAVKRGQLTNIWSSNIISTRSKMSIFKSTVMPILLYGASTWTPLACHLNRIRGFVTTSLKKIARVKWNEHVSNSDLYGRLHLQLPENLIQKARLNYFGHVMRMDSYRLPQLCFLQRYDGPRPPHGVRKRWRDVIFEDIKPLNLDNAINFISNRPNWARAVQDLSLKSLLPKQSIVRPKCNKNDKKDFICPYEDCKRVCNAEIGLISHIAAHKREEAKVVCCQFPNCCFKTTTVKRLDAHRLAAHAVPSSRMDSKDAANKTIHERAVLITCPQCNHTSTKSGITRHKCTNFQRRNQ